MSRLFEPNETVTRWTVGLYQTTAVLSIPMFVLRLIQAGARSSRALEGLANGMGGLVALVGLVAVVLLLVWMSMAYNNLEPLGNTEPTLSTGWAVAGWLIPVVSLVLPYVALRELWQSSAIDLVNADRAGRRTVPVPRSLAIWLGVKLIPGLYSLVAVTLMVTGRFGLLVHWGGVLWVGVLITGANVVNSFLLAGIVREIQERQVARWHRLEARRAEALDQSPYPR